MPVTFLREDLESALDDVLAAGDFEGVGLHVSHLGPGVESVAVGERHAEVAAELVRERGLVMSSFNVTGDFGFDPFTNGATFARSAEKVAYWLRLGAALEAPRVMMWDGVAELPDDACARLRECIEAGRERSGLADPPPLTLELHPFTFALAHRRIAELIETLPSIGDVSLCWDFAHFAVALGPEFISELPDGFSDAIGEVHWCDSDGASSELHFPPGKGVLDLAALEAMLGGRPVPILWDLFSWPAPRDAIRRYMGAYAAAIARHTDTIAAQEKRYPQ